MAIKIVDDVVVPVGVAAVDQLTLKFTTASGNEWAAYGMTALGYIGAGLNKGGDMVKNVGIASLPLTVRALMARFNIAHRASGSTTARFQSSGKMTSSRTEFANSQIG